MTTHRDANRIAGRQAAVVARELAKRLPPSIKVEAVRYGQREGVMVREVVRRED